MEKTMREVVNLDKDGNVIPDLSKKKLPKELNDLFVRLLWENSERSA